MGPYSMVISDTDLEGNQRDHPPIALAAKTEIEAVVAATIRADTLFPAEAQSVLIRITHEEHAALIAEIRRPRPEA